MKNQGKDSSRPLPEDDRLLTVAVISLDIASGDVSENLRRMEVMAESLPSGVDIAVLPELFTTSFMKDTDRMLAVAEGNDGPTMEAVRRLAERRNMLVAGSFLACETADDGAGRFFNRGFLVMPDGRRVFYDKHHLFCLSKEAELMEHGQARPPLVSFRGWNVSMLICYELRFPVWGRNVEMRADIVLVPANWPCNRGYAWRQLIIARAIENQVVVAGADRSGRDDYGEYDGLSLIVDELGRQIAPAPEFAPSGCPLPDSYGDVVATPFGPLAIATFSLNKVKKLRGWLPTHRDADSFSFTRKTDGPES
ncbi:MAG: hypothetical protein K2L39_07635 [Muribaculaceae bacterium]|nr:hypothetical protein [Muribaculaceae bacterium]MDE6361075.1 hypothetical protein [Muribaculaceae bacterium]